MKIRNLINLHELRSLFFLIIIVLSLKETIFELYIVPTGSMENTIMTGDMLVGNRFVYGMRTPSWIGIPYTDLGFFIPSIKFPPFKIPKRGDVIIFKFPRDVRQKYVKRCVAEPGDEFEIKNKIIYLNGNEYPLPENGKFLMNPYSEDFNQQDIFLGSLGNKDNFSKLRIPKKGDVIDINPKNAQLLLHLMLLDGHKVTLKNSLQNYHFTMTSPDELWRRKGKPKVYEPYYPQGKLLVPWSTNNLPSGMIMVDGVPITEMKSYIVEQNYYWAMGDNRDDSLDSRFWGFVPESHILGEALLAYFSLDISSFPYIPRFGRIGTIIQ
tara:strand:+ start:157 stop:1128 length:972 start_codon:yes stop_codon:yes gene_type:complete